jgi:hypothetical protein
MSDIRKPKESSVKYSFNRLLNWLEFIFMVFFVLMDSIAIVILINPMHNQWAQITTLIAGILLSIILTIKYWRSKP